MRTADPHAPTKEKILGAAQKLMMAKGFTATSVDDICEEAGASKGSFFHFFKSKEELAKILMERYTEMRLARMRSAPSYQSKDPRVRALGLVDFAIAAFEDPAMEKSCITGNLAQELAPTNPGMRAACAESFEKVAQEFAGELRAAKAPKAIELAEMFFSLMQGSLIMVKTKQDVGVGVRNMKHFRRYLESQLP